METKRLCRLQILKLLVLIISLVVVIIVLSQLITLPYNSSTLIVPSVTKGVLVNEVTVNSNMNTSGSIESGSVLKTLSVTHEKEVNKSEEEGCKGDDCNHGSLLSQSAMKQNGSSQMGQTSQRVAVSLEPTRLSYMVSVLESTVAAHSNVGTCSLLKYVVF